MPHRHLLLPLALLFAGLLQSCHTLDDERIPAVPVRVAFTSLSEWEFYGVSGAMQHKQFILDQHIPSNFPYTALSRTGFGGILLVSDIHGVPVAYDLACPVERKATIRVNVDSENNVAECPECHSTYDIYSNLGHPLSGEASRKGYGLTRYYVGPGLQGEYMVISR